MVCYSCWFLCEKDVKVFGKDIVSLLTLVAKCAVFPLIIDSYICRPVSLHPKGLIRSSFVGWFRVRFGLSHTFVMFEGSGRL